MNTDFQPPPKQNSDPKEWDQWFARLWRFVRPAISQSGDTAAEVPSGSSYHAITALSAPRIITLPATAEVPDAGTLIVQDESGAAAAQNITLAPQGTDIVRGPTTITTNYGRRVLIRRQGKWMSA